MLASLYLVGGWVFRLVMIPVVARRHRPFVALSWLAPIFLFPVVGTVLYFWLSRYGLQRGAERHRAVRRRVETDDRLREQDRFASDDVPPEQEDLVRLASRLSTRRLGGFPILDGNRLDLLSEPGEAIDRLIGEIDAARETAHLLFYHFAVDRTGRRVADALARAAARGVTCRLMIDDWMSSDMDDELRPWLEERGVRVCPVLPVSLLHRPLQRLDVRNHRKIAVLDARVAMTGSDNIHDPGYELEEGVWHQLSVRIEGPAVLQLQMLFVEDWYFATDELLDGRTIFPEPAAAGDVTVQTVPGGPSYDENLLQHVYVQVLAEAQERVVVVTPYFVPDEPTTLALRLAALRGVRVDLIVPEESDERLTDLAGHACYQGLLDMGVRIHRHTSGLLHTKAIAVDDAFCLIGTANFDRRSLFLNYELMLLIFHREFTVRVRDRLLAYLDDCREIDPEEWRARPEPRQVLEHTVRLLSPVL